MVKITHNGEKFFKIVFWGCANSGKTTYVDTLWKICRDEQKEIISEGKLTKIDMAGGHTLYFDRGVFRFKESNKTYFHTFTVAGQTRLGPLRKKIILGTDALIFFVDAQRSRLEDNINSLRELKRNIRENNNLQNIPMIVVINKNDLDDIITPDEWESYMSDMGIFTMEDNRVIKEEPVFFETIALFEKKMNVYESYNALLKKLMDVHSNIEN
ncbi:MAG: ADP-ribosylation factor-like protein [Promethearchaeota archaeon]